MKLTLIGHEDRYAVEQLQMALFSADSPVEALSSLSRGKVWLTATFTAYFTSDFTDDISCLNAFCNSFR